MLRNRTSLALIALVAAAAPLHAQAPRYDAGSFSIELPSGVAQLRLIRKVEDPASAFEGYVGAGVHRGSRVLVMVNRTMIRGLPSEVTRRDSAALRRLLADTSSARWREVRESRLDNSPAAQRVFALAMRDTSLAARRLGLQRAQALFSNGDGWIRTEGEGREIVREDLLALRLPVTVDLDAGLYRGLVDISIARRGMDTWTVIFAALEPTLTPALEAAAVRMLDSFRPAPVAPTSAAPE
jgi:hypothetical protein